MRKTVFVWLVLCAVSATAAIIQSCCNPDPVKYTLLSILGYSAKITGSEKLSENLKDSFVVQNNPEGSIRYDSIGLITDPAMRISFNTTGALQGVLLACSPAEYQEHVSDIVVLSNTDYNATHPAGTDLKDIISVREWSYQHNYSVEGMPLSEFVPYKWLTDNALFFTFDAPPSEQATHRFTIRFIMEDEREFESVIEAVTVIN